MKDETYTHPDVLAEQLKTAHAHVTFDYGQPKRHFLGVVRGWYRDDVTGTIRLEVYHLNGERWLCPYYGRPLNPPVRSVEILERTYPEDEA